VSLGDLRRSICDEGGVALPLAMMALVLLSGIIIAFVAVAGMEPLIADNHQASNQAASLAEGGLERAIWAVGHSVASGVDDPPPAAPYTAPAPYDASVLAALGPGGYSIRVCRPDAAGCRPAPGPTGSSRDWNVIATGYVVREGTALPAAPAGMTDANRIAQRTVNATLTWIGPPNLPGALTVAGSVDLGGNTMIGGNNLAEGVPNSCPMQTGVTIRDTTSDPGPDGRPGTADDGDPITHTLTQGGSSSVDGAPRTQTVDEKTFNATYLFSQEQLEALREYAKARGTYIKPISDGQMNLTVTDGLFFVDTVNGVSLGHPPDPSALANVRITGAANSGWLIVMGSLTLDGDITYHGLIYSVNDLRYRGTGRGGIYGAVVSANAVDTRATVIDTTTLGSSKIHYDCEKVKNGGGTFTPPQGYVVKRGTWRDVTN
jgi:hypothetical protein